MEAVDNTCQICGEPMDLDKFYFAEDMQVYEFVCDNCRIREIKTKEMNS